MYMGLVGMKRNIFTGFGTGPKRKRIITRDIYTYKLDLLEL